MVLPGPVFPQRKLISGQQEVRSDSNGGEDDDLGPPQSTHLRRQFPGQPQIRLTLKIVAGLTRSRSN
jgi:hypothetical protein